MTEQRNRCHVRRMMEDWVELYGYYEVLSVEHTEDCDHGSCVLFEIKKDFITKRRKLMNRYYVEVKHPWNKNLVSIYVYAYSPEHIKDIIEGKLVTIDQTD
jgi:hypothetical protein